MRDFTIKYETIINENEKFTAYKGMFAPGLDIQLTAMAIFFGLGLFLILQFNTNNKKKNLITALLSSALFLFLLWWYSLPESAFYSIFKF
jgi:hypothetical protein